MVSCGIVQGSAGKARGGNLSCGQPLVPRHMDCDRLRLQFSLCCSPRVETTRSLCSAVPIGSAGAGSPGGSREQAIEVALSSDVLASGVMEGASLCGFFSLRRRLLPLRNLKARSKTQRGPRSQPVISPVSRYYGVSRVFRGPISWGIRIEMPSTSHQSYQRT